MGVPFSKKLDLANLRAQAASKLNELGRHRKSFLLFFSYNEIGKKKSNPGNNHQYLIYFLLTMSEIKNAAPLCM